MNEVFTLMTVLLHVWGVWMVWTTMMVHPTMSRALWYTGWFLLVVNSFAAGWWLVDLIRG